MNSRLTIIVSTVVVIAAAILLSLCLTGQFTGLLSPPDQPNDPSATPTSTAPPSEGPSETTTDPPEPIIDPTVEVANDANCISFAALYQWYESSKGKTWSEKEQDLVAAYNNEFRHYADIALLFDHVHSGAGSAA